jgi:hypothetical protein
MHTVCKTCGDYNGRKVLNTVSKAEKKLAKAAPKAKTEKVVKTKKVAKKETKPKATKVTTK